MASGQLCSSIGAYDNAAEFPAEIPTYAHYLRELGYHTLLSGKMHFIGPDQFHGFERRLTSDLYPADFSWVPNWGDEGERDTNDPRSVTVSGLCESSKQIEFDDEVTSAAVAALSEIASSSDQRPFFLQVSYTHPHEPYLCQQRHWDLYNDLPVPMPAIRSLPREQHDAHSLRLLEDFGMLDVVFDDTDILRSRRAYYGSISYIDEQIAGLLSALERLGLNDNTAIVFTSDHGDMLGERGMWFKKHFFEPSLHVPLSITAPWLAPGRVTTLVSLVDLLPTFMGLASGSTWSTGIEPLAGDDLTAFLPTAPSGTPTTIDRTVCAEYLAEATTAPIFMLRQGEYKYIASAHDPALLFNVQRDPSELDNLAGKPEYSQRVAEFQRDVERRWDQRALAERIVLSQQRRRLIRAATQQGVPVRWNHDEVVGDEVRWYRGEGSYNEWAFDYVPITST